MLDIQSCLKINFQGEIGFIICDTGSSSYENIINQACERFHIAESQRAGLVLTNGQGYVFEKQLLEYFLVLFPCPELMFYLRMDWQKLRRAVATPIKRRRPSEAGDDVKSAADESDLDYVAVPVHRQNCFIGVLPTNSSQSSSLSSAGTLRRQHCILRLHPQKTAAKPATTTTTTSTRLQHLERIVSTRLNQCQPGKRIRLQPALVARSSMPSAAPHLAILSSSSNSTRSIRI